MGETGTIKIAQKHQVCLYCLQIVILSTVFVKDQCGTDMYQGWTLNFERTRHSGEWPSKCTRPDQFSLAQKFTPLAPPLKPLRLSNHCSRLLFLPLITGSFRGFFLPFSLRLLWRLLKYISTFFFYFVRDQFMGEHAMIRKLGKYGKQFACNVVKHYGRPRIISSMKNSI